MTAGIFDDLIAAARRIDLGGNGVGRFPSIVAGFGVPTAAEATGSIYLRMDAPNAALMLYVRANDVWVVAASLGDISVNTEALLSATDVSNMSDGTFAWVGNPVGGVGQSQGSVWQLTTTSFGGTLPALAAHLVIASPNAGRRWMRLVSIPNQKWVQNDTWFLDGTAGDDQNDGRSAGTALQTGAELARRMAKQQVGNGSTVTVTLVSNIADALDFRGVTAIGGINVVATEPTQANGTGTLTGATAINRAVAPFFQQIVAAGVDFAPFIATKSKIVLTSGPNLGAYSWFESGAGGVGVAAQTSAFALPTTGTPAIISPAGNETYKIVSALTCTMVMTDGPGLTISSAGGLTLSLTGIRPTAQGTAQRGPVVIWIGCDLSAGSYLARGSTQVLNGCKTAFIGGGSGIFVTINQCLVTGAITGTYGGQTTIQSDTLISDATVFPNNGGIVLCQVGWHNVSAAKHAVDSTGVPGMGQVQLSSAAQAGAIYGSLAGAGSIGFNLGTFMRVQGAGVVPTMTTTGVNVQFGSASKTWAQVPFSDYVVGAPGAANCSAWI